MLARKRKEASSDEEGPLQLIEQHGGRFLEAAEKVAIEGVRRIGNGDVKAVGVAVVVGLSVVNAMAKFMFGRRGKDENEMVPPVVEKQLISVGARAVESRGQEKLFYDPIAIVIAKETWIHRAEKLDAQHLTELCLRARFIDDFTRMLLQKSEDIKQVVSVGCALETRIYRLALERDDVTFFDLDEPEVINYRQAALSHISEALRREMPSSVLITADVGVVGWDSEVIVHGFNWNERSLWIIEDPSHMDEDRVEVFFRNIGLLMTSDSAMVMALSEATEEKLSNISRLVQSCGYQIHASTFIGDSQASYGRWTGDRSRTCIMSLSHRPRKSTLLTTVHPVSEAEKEASASIWKENAL